MCQQGEEAAPAITGAGRSRARTGARFLVHGVWVGCLLGSLPAVAMEEAFFSELPIVASVSRLPQRQADAPTAVTVISREVIRASGARALSDVLRLVPGFQTYTHSDKPTRVSYHGITDDNDYSPRVQVLVDGRSLHSPLFRGGMNWELVPVALEDIERIEVVRGSNNTSYGTNAFLGVINIITVDPALAHGVSVAVSNGSQGVRDYLLRAGGSFGQGGELRLTYKQLQDDGLDESSVPLMDATWQDRHRARLLDLKANYQIDIRNLLELSLGRIEGRSLTGRWEKDADDVPLPGVPEAGNPMRDADQSSTWVQLRWLRTLDNSADLSLRYAHSVDEANDAYHDESNPPGYQRVNVTGDRGTRHELEAVHTFLPLVDTRLAWGGSWRRDGLRSDTLLRDRGTVHRSVGRVFGNAEWKPSVWFTGNLGLSHEYDSIAGSHNAPRASASFHLNEKHTVRVGYARAWRTASTVDYRANYFDGPGDPNTIGNRGLPAERLDSWELAYLGDWPALRMSLDIRSFRERVSDRHHHRIEVGPDAPDSVQALEDLHIRGNEVQWKWRPVEGTRIAVGYAAVRTAQSLNANGRRLADPASDSNFYRGLDRYTLLAEESAPRNSASVLLMQQLPFGVELSVAHYQIDAIKWTRNTVNESYARTDLRIAYPLRFGTQRGELSYTVQSLEGAHSEERMERIVDRRHWVSLQLDF